MFGLASAVTVIIFGIVLLISAISFKYSKIGISLWKLMILN